MFKKRYAEIMGMIEDGILDAAGNNPEWFHDVIDSRIKLLLTDEEFLKKVGKQLSIADAHRLIGENDRKLEELSAKEVEMRDSPEPWFDMQMFGWDAEHGAKIQTEWNNAFVKYLKELGFSGQNEEQMVQHYIGMLGAEAMATEIDA